MRKFFTTSAGPKAALALLLLLGGFSVGGCQREAGAQPVDQSQPTPPRRGSGSY